MNDREDFEFEERMRALSEITDNIERARRGLPRKPTRRPARKKKKETQNKEA